jgi:hypothetical protein
MTIELLTMIVVFKPAGTDHGAFEYVLGCDSRATDAHRSRDI